MDRRQFRDRVRRKLVILDGATGTELRRRGMPDGVCPDAWALDNPDVLRSMQREYREAGADIVYSCTFGSNRLKLKDFGLEDRVAPMNRELARLSREAVGEGLVFGDLAPTGQFVQPFGDFPFEEAVETYKEQVRALIEGGVDGFVIETMMDIQEARAALLAVRETCDLPAMVSLTYGEDGRTLSGTPPAAAVITLQALGADAVGCNCSTGPDDMLGYIQAMKAVATVPLLAKPNAGMPRLVGQETVFDMDAATFASFVAAFVRAGVNLLGGCCGTTPDHIRALADASTVLQPAVPLADAVGAVTSARSAVFFRADAPLALIGERINPTGKKKLQAELRAGRFDLVRQYGLEQAEAGAALLDVNVGLSGIDEAAMLAGAVEALVPLVETPLCLDSTNAEAMAKALRLYPGRALVNSVSLEKVKLETILPLAAKYGAMFVLLPLDDGGVPATVEARAALTEKIYAEAKRYGYRKEDFLIDGLVLSASAEPAGPRMTLDFLDWISRSFGAASLIGTSNVSFGMPQRKWLNAAFLGMAMGRGLAAAIANPADEGMQAIRLAGDVLLGHDEHAARYVARFAAVPESETPEASVPPGRKVYLAVLRGEKDRVAAVLDEALAAGEAAGDLVDRQLIPAITEVGARFDRKEYFLPQLILSADTMKAAFDRLAPQLGDRADADRLGGGRPVLLATVEGDVHDIGKNLVALMLQNYGFRVMDLGKDVSAADIVAAAKDSGARLVGLSALMTTTMVEMREVIDLARREGLDTRFMVGGAVVDARYADEIGADGYAPDAIGAVRLAQELSSNED